MKLYTVDIFYCNISIIFLALQIVFFVSANRVNFLSEDYVNSINRQNLSWKAGINFDETVPMQNILSLVASEKPRNKNNSQFEEYSSHAIVDENLFRANVPDYFDARKKWPTCKTIGDVYDQGNCQSGWAIAPMSTLADRLCIATRGKFNQPLSFGYVLSCCYLCGRGCKGGWDDSAWHFAQKYGVPTGGHYGSNEGCYPYSIPPCNHDKTNKTATGCIKLESTTPKCRTTCLNRNYSVKYEDDLQKVDRIHFMKPGEIERSKLQLMIVGPLEAFFEVYSDFFSYKTGIYQVSTDAEFVGYHAVKIIGWGMDQQQGVPYWLVVNSWGKRWGDKGLFKIRILENGANFEDKFITGFPLLK